MTFEVVDHICRTRLDGFLGLPVDNSTPASRARLAALYAGAASLGSLATLMAPSPEAAAGVAAATLCCAAWAARAWRASRRPYYLLPDPAPLPLATWEVVPGQGIGPFELGPPGAETIQALRRARACMWHVSSVAYILGGPSGWVAVCLLAPRHREDRNAPPDPASLLEVVWVETSHPFHATAQGVAPDLRAREVTARMGPPMDVTHPAWGGAVLHYPGLRVTVLKGRVRSLRVLTADPLEAARPWNL